MSPYKSLYNLVNLFACWFFKEKMYRILQCVKCVNIIDKKLILKTQVVYLGSFDDLQSVAVQK